MGVRGLTTFIANRSGQYLESYDLHDSNIVIDGNSIACQLYKWHCKCNDCFGGDYDKYAKVILDFFQLLFDCNVTPLIVFDGAYEKRKIKTVYSRMRNKIDAAKNLNSVTEGRISLFPLFLRELFMDIVLKLGLKCARCDFEGDSDTANLARNLGCPVLSYDSDFYIFDVLYIPFSTVELRLRKKKNVNYIKCEVYRVDRFLNSFGGLDKVNLPLLAAMLGNDYIKKSAFKFFYRHLKMCKTKGNEQQTQIKSVIVWLKNETPESALRKILGRYRLRNRRKLAWKIKKAIRGYQSQDTEICNFFNVKTREEIECIQVPEPEEIEEAEDKLDEDTEESSEESEESSEESEESSEESEEEDGFQPVFKFSIPIFFRENYRKCLYPPCFMDILVSNTYFSIPQIDDSNREHSHAISLNLLAAIHRILTFPKTQNLICVARNEHLNVKKFRIPLCEKELPKLADIEHLGKPTSKKILLEILELDSDICDHFPDSWHLFLLSMKYWVENSKTKVTLPYIYSLILCGIVLNKVDNKAGFYRSTKSFLAKFSTHSGVPKPTSTKHIIEALDEIDLDNSVCCLKKLIHFFQMDAKMKCYVKLYDKGIVHEFANFQSCLLHINYLNTLLNFPFPNFVISDFFDGTFLYNMTQNLLKRTDLKNYLRLLLENCPKVLGVFELMAEKIETEIEGSLWKHEPRKKRKKRKKVRDSGYCDVIEKTSDLSENEGVYDKNNKFSLLSFIN